MGSFTVHADFNALDGGATLTTQVTIRSNTQVIASGGVIYDAAAHPLEAGVLQVELPANDNDPFDFGYTITRANGLTKVWRIPAQNPGVTVELTTFTATTPLPLPPSGNAVSQTDYAAYTTSNDAAVAANATAIGNEVTRATAAEATKVNSSTYTSGQATQDAALTAETTRATAAEGTNATAITGEATTARAAELALRNLSDATFAANLSASIAQVKAWARDPNQLIVGAVTRDANGAATSAPVVWPDGSPGTYTADTVSTAFPGAVDAYHITYGSPVTKTYTQPAVTRDASTGAVTALPAIVVS